MIPWTEAARAAFARHLEKIRPALAEAGIDPAAAAARLEQAIESRLNAARATRVTPDLLDAALASLAEKDAMQKSGRGGRRSGWGVRSSILLLIGVILPAVALGTEFFTGLCSMLFDPIPTALHVAAIALVVAANGYGLRAMMQPDQEGRLRRAARLTAWGAGIALYYTLWFLPLTPLGLIGIAFFGLGILVLAPLFALVVASILQRKLRWRAAGAGVPVRPLWRGFAAGLALMLAAELPGVLQTWAAAAVAHGDARQAARGLAWLRLAGNENQMRRAAYGRWGEYDDMRRGLFGYWFGEISADDWQRIFYRVTGAPFTSRPPPAFGRSFLGRREIDPGTQWVWDGAQGDDRVGQHLPALFLTESRIDGAVEGDAAVGFLEWTMVFRNDHQFQQREARALIQLPPGTVVSRLTLWIDGEEREAAFGGRAQVRSAYQQVVAQRRDPVLVTTKGPDQVLVQCFPVAPHGGEMKVRLGLTVPLALDRVDQGRLALPRLIGQNFSLAPGLRHALWLKSRSPLQSAQSAWQREAADTGRSVLRARVTADEFADPATAVTVGRDPASLVAWTRDPLDATRTVVQQWVRRAPAPGTRAIVVDGSRDLAGIVDALADELATLPDSFSFSLRVAGDEVLVCPEKSPAAAGAWLRRQKFSGGQDATDAIDAAIGSLDRGEGTVWWIHGPQPLRWQSQSSLGQRLAREAGRIRLVEFPAVRGENRLLEELAREHAVTAAPRVGGFREDLTRFFSQEQNGAWEATRRLGTEPPPVGVEASSHLVALWARDEVARLMADRESQSAATSLAVARQIVTPASAAVVLETRQQYTAAELEPADPALVPTVPETASTLGLLAGGMIFLVAIATRRSRPAVVRGPPPPPEAVAAR